MLLGAFDVNIIWVMLISFTLFMAILGPVVTLLTPCLPTFLVESFRYGKTLNGPLQSSLVSRIKIPKNWFSHFYVFACLYIPFLYVLCVQVYLLQGTAPKYVKDGLDFVCGLERRPSARPEAILLVVTLLLIQCFRRLYECFYVNAKSNSVMNVLHYIVGFSHYFCAGTGILCEAPGFVRQTTDSRLTWLHFDISFFHLGFIDFLMVIIFFQAWQHQFNAHKIFAELKKAGANRHGIPKGDWFSFVSCPHYLCEILMYTCFMIILGLKHQTGIILWFWVTVNQIVAGFMSHKWYKEHFKEYPEERAAVIPFLL